MCGIRLCWSECVVVVRLCGCGSSIVLECVCVCGSLIVLECDCEHVWGSLIALE